MEHQQLELNFEGALEHSSAAKAGVVSLQTFAEARARKLKQLEEEKLVAEIIKSVEHITGRSPDAEVM